MSQTAFELDRAAPRVARRVMRINKILAALALMLSIAAVLAMVALFTPMSDFESWGITESGRTFRLNPVEIDPAKAESLARQAHQSSANGKSKP